MDGPETNAAARAAMDEGQILPLFSVPHLDGTSPNAGGRSNHELWSELAAAVMSQEAFDRLDDELQDGSGLAEVVELDAWRNGSR